MVSCPGRLGYFVRLWLAADLVYPSPFASFALGVRHLDKSRFGGWLGWQEKSRVDL